MTTETETLKSDDVAITTSKTSKTVKAKSGGGRPAGYSPKLPFTTGKLCKGLAENAFKEFVTLNELCESGKATSDDLTNLLKKQAVAGLEVRKAASLVWLTQGMLLHTLKDSLKASGTPWMQYFDENLAVPLNLSPRSEQLQRKMFTDWQAATAQLPAQATRALEECEQVNDLAGKLKKLSAGRDPWAEPPAEESATLVDESAKRRQTKLRQVKKLADELGDLGYPSDIIHMVNELFDAMQAATVDVGAVTATETIDVVVDEPESLADAIGNALETAAA
jgi:hypothetical protein